MKKLITIIIMAAIMISCGGGRYHYYSTGDDVVITEECIGAYDEESYKQMTDYCVARDEAGLERMSDKGKIRILYTGASGVATDMKVGMTKIRLSSGDELWVASEFVQGKQ